MKVKEAAAIMGRKGGKVSSKAKKEAAKKREEGKRLKRSKLLTVALICFSVAFLALYGLASAATFTSPEGHVFKLSGRMFMDQPLYLYTGIIQGKPAISAYIGKELDRKIAECKASHPEVPAYIKERAETITYKIINHWGFPCGASGTGMCVGLTDGQTYIKTGLYSRWQGDGRLPYGVKFAPQSYIGNYDLYLQTGIYGWYETRTLVNWGEADVLMESLCHELEHVWNVPGTQAMENFTIQRRD